MAHPAKDIIVNLDVELKRTDADGIAALAQRRNVALKDIVSEAISSYLIQAHDEVKPPRNLRHPERDYSAFGMWAGLGIDGVEYQNKAREE